MKEIFARFDVDEQFISAVLHGNGHINETFLVTTNSKGIFKRYILQKINHRVFKDVEGLMNNIAIVTSYVKEKSPQSVYQKIIKTRDNKNYYFDNRTYTYWRVFTFVDNCIALDQITDPVQFYETGLAFGNFQKTLDGFDASLLVETIEDFHNTEKRLAAFELAVKNNLLDRAELAQDEIDYLISKREYACVVVSLLKKKAIPYRVTHNDTKLDNVLFHVETGKALSVVDLDTIMPGSILYDFGDAIRFGANKGKEDERDLSKVGIDLNLFELFTQGFLENTAETITTQEVNLLAFSSILITYELAMRFLGDYLEGDVYFRTKEKNHNLIRARAQIALMKDMEENLDKMESIVKRIYNNCLSGNCKSSS